MGRYRCWSCGATGDIFNWVMETQKVEFAEALTLLAARAGVTLSKENKGPSRREAFESAMSEALVFFQRSLEAEPAAKIYCESRNITSEVIAAWQLGYGPGVGDALAHILKKAGHSLQECRDLFLVDQDQGGGFFGRFRDRLIFPIHDERGGLVAFGGRIIGAGIPKYINSSDTPLYSKSKVLYGMHKAKESISKSGTAVLVEGYLDVIACHRAGVTSAVATLGTSLAEDHVKLLSRWCQEVVILYDSDAAGQKAAEKASRLCQEAGLRVRIALMPPGDDPDTLLRTQGPLAVQRAIEQTQTPVEFILRSLQAKYPDRRDQAYWDEVVQALTLARNDLERERFLHEVAADYPGVRDVAAAKRALGRMVRQAMTGGDKALRSSSQTSVVPSGKRAYDMSGPERVLIRAMNSPTTKKVALDALGQAKLFYSSDAIAVIESLSATGTTQGPAELLDQLPQGRGREVLELLLWEEEEPLPLAAVEDALKRLQRLASERELKALGDRAATDDELLRQLSEKLRQQKGGNPED
jgi:DNA primase